MHTKTDSVKRIGLFALSTFAASAAWAQTNTYPFPSSGWVGLGTQTPRQSLEVNGAIAVNGQRSGTWSAGHIMIGDNLDWIRYHFAVRGTLDSPNSRFVLFYHASSNDTYWEGLTLEPAVLGGTQFDLTLNRGAFRVRDNGSIYLKGNVSVGAQDQFAPLHVAPNLNQLEPTLVFPDRTNTRYSVGLGSRQVGGEGQALDFYAGDSGSNGTNLPSSTRRMTLTATGKLGVGTSSPTGLLHVASSDLANPVSVIVQNTNAGGAQIQLKTSVGNEGGGLTWDNNNGKFFVFSGASSPLCFRSGGSQSAERMRIDATGNVGIGTTSPTHKLSVNGSIRAKEVIVETSGWADYVLAEKYELAPLSEVERHIKTHGTLPGIPSSAEVQENGVNVSEMQAKLLAKVEELTLHLIALEKENKRLNSEMVEIKTRVGLGRANNNLLNP